MKRTLLRHTGLAVLMARGVLAAEAPPPQWRGFTRTTGGTDGEVVRVTHLDAEGPGSLRAALSLKRRRLVVFEVGGVIDLQRNSLVISDPHVTIAGQTAPSPGITLIRGGVSVRTHDVIMQHLRIRPGDAGQPIRSGWEPDALSTSGRDAHDIVVDHCSLTWATDENLSASGPRLEGPEATSRRVTFSNNIIAECLHVSTHAKGAHSMGSLIHDFCRDIAVVGNLYAHHHQRNPYFKAHTTGVIVNNLVYNPGTHAIQLGYSQGEWDGSKYQPKNCLLSIVGNVLFHGSDTRQGLPLITRPGDVYLEDNLAFDASGTMLGIHDGAITVLEHKPLWPEDLGPLPAVDLAGYIIRQAGARPWDRDEVDIRIVRSFENRTGRIINSQDEVGGYPQHAPVMRPLEVPAHNRESWLSSFEREPGAEAGE